MEEGAHGATPPSLLGFGFNGYRSFRESANVFVPLGKVTLIAGQNNAGKSNVLRFARDYLKADPAQPDDQIDRPLDTLPQAWALRMRLALPRPTIESLPEHVQRTPERTSKSILEVLRSITEHFALRYDDDTWLFPYVIQAGDHGNKRRWVADGDALATTATDLKGDVGGAIRQVGDALGNSHRSGGDVGSPADVVYALQALLPNLDEWLPPVRLIEAFRQIRPGAIDQDDVTGVFEGVGLVQRLEALERPASGSTRRADERKFQQINEFVRYILDDPTASLQIPHDARTVDVRRGDDVLPLESMGTGVHQVVLLAAAATLLEGHLVCIEEPEVHLHPLLQRRLVRYLHEKTSNQYLIATHSAHLLDYERGAVFHLTLTQAGTEVAKAGNPHELARLCHDLGYRPSDLLQANAVIWVEGPSDRIYIRHWIGLLDPELVEGIHFSIMFYGGSVLNHLSPDDPAAPGLAVQEHNAAVEDFISLRRLNRHLAVVMDSDVTKRGGRITPTKQRVRQAFERGDGPGAAWVTKCYTIENYVPRQLLLAAVAEVHPRWKLVADAGQWANPLRFTNAKHKPDKVAIARRVCSSWPNADLDLYDLRRQVRRLVAMVRQANGLPAGAG